MSSASTFCSAPVSCSLDSTSQQAQVSLEWVLSAGIRSCGGEVRGTLLLDASGTTVSMLLCAVVRSSLPYDLLLGRDWLHFCRDTLPDAVFTLSSGIVHPGKPSVMHATSPSPSLSSPLPLDRVNPTEPALSPGGSCLCDNPLACRCASTSTRPLNNVHLPSSATQILREVFLGHHVTRTRASVFHTDLTAIQRVLDLHAIPSHGLNLLECRRLLIRHLATGTCTKFNVDATTFPRPDRTACRVFSDSFGSASNMANCVRQIILDADEKQISTEALCHIAAALGVAVSGKRNLRFKLRAAIRSSTFSDGLAAADSTLTSESVERFFDAFERHSKPALLAIAALHRVEIPETVTSDTLRHRITEHIVHGECSLRSADHQRLSDEDELVPDCSAIHSDWQRDNADLDLQTYILECIYGGKTSRNPMRRVLASLKIDYLASDGLGTLRRKLKSHIASLRRGKKSQRILDEEAAARALRATRIQEIHANWPQQVPQSLKNKLIQDFRAQTNSEALSTFVCASCAECFPLRDHCSLDVGDTDIDLTVLRRPDLQSNEDDLADAFKWLNPNTTPPPMPFDEGPLADLLLDPEGVSHSSAGASPILSLCQDCLSCLRRCKVPPLSLANRNYLAPVPPELQDLTMIEESMIARSRAKCWILKLKEENQDLELPTTQRGMKGHVIIYPQHPSRLAESLPPSVEEITAPVCVLFVGASKPTAEWLRDHAKPLAVDARRVRKALQWLKAHNPLYRHVKIDEERLQQLETNPVLPFNIEHIQPTTANEATTSRYDALDLFDPGENSEGTIPFENIVIADVECRASSSELRAAAMRHVKKKGGGYIQLPHDRQAENDFRTDGLLFPLIYPTLFPYGIGGPNDSKRAVRVSLKRNIKHLLNLSDRRFQEHPSFSFTAFNILQRHDLLLHTSLKVKRSNFNSLASQFASVSPQVVQAMSERVANGESPAPKNAEEKKVLTLLKQVNAVVTSVPGSSAARVAMRNEIRGLMIEKGLPSFYITINPADVFSPVLKFLSGAEIDIDALLPEDVPNYWDQASVIAKNPVVAARFFNVYMKAFLDALLAFDPAQKNLDGGILGVVKAHYGCVEAQGRGTLHCHMLVWVEGGLNPNDIKKRALGTAPEDLEFRTRLVSFLDDTISNSIPPDPDPNLVVSSDNHNACSVRGEPVQGDSFPPERKKDLRNVAIQCQSHKHSKTCFKYWPGPPHPKTCRFDLHEDNFRAETFFDPETGEINLRCLDGLVNNFNATMLEAIRNNMDIKFIGSGASAKGILYYITDYITKSQLKTHVAFAMLELAVKKLGEFNAGEDDISTRGRRLLQKCAYAMISQQELSGQQVASYLLDLDDHFTSHSFRNLHWIPFEISINADDPSPECYVRKSVRSEAPVGEAVDSSGSESDHESNDVPRFLSDVLEDADPGHDDEQAEVQVAFDNSGNLRQKGGNALQDYRMRGHELDHVCAWDFISRVDRVSRASDRQSKREQTAFVDAEQAVEDNGEENVWDSNAYKRPRIDLLPGHDQESSHILRLRSPEDSLITVPIGPGIPRRDKPELFARYARLMLIFFKPWRTAKDLREEGQTWSDAFEAFRAHCSTEIQFRMENMQVLHECRDSRDDHFAERRYLARKSVKDVQRKKGRTEHSDDFGGQDVTEQMILNHLHEVSDRFSHRKTAARETTGECLIYAEEAGLYTVSESHPAPGIETSDDVHFVSSTTSEDIWEKAYEDRRGLLKQGIGSQPAEVVDAETSASASGSSGSFLTDGSALREALRGRNQVAEIRQDIPRTEPEAHVDIEAHVEKWTLNTEQARAFRIIASHSLEARPEQLRMLLSGPGGTGKSRVIHALEDFFSLRGQSRRLRLAAYTGVAARNIRGMTLHSALCLNQRGRGGSQSKTRRDLTVMWEGVDYLFIDEVSMVGCALLLQISEALMDAKGSAALFGGVNMIFAGDFAQLPPVGMKSLYSKLNTNIASASGRRGQQDISGKLLWLSVRCVVILTRVERVHQNTSANENSGARFVELLGRLRQGRCTNEDFALLNSRLITRLRPDWTPPHLRNVPVIVATNQLKDVLNQKAADVYSARTGKPLHWYYAQDTRSDGSEIEDAELREYLATQLHSGETNYRLGKLPLAVDMPVMVTQNFDVQSGVVNGATGFVKQIRYTVNRWGERCVQSCIVYIPEMTGPALPNLPEKHAAILPDSVDMKFSHPDSGQKCLIKRTQLPLVPAFAMTAHKAQGKTMDAIIVDLESTSGTESPYVMLSRATSLSGVYILRPFQQKVIQRHPSQDVREEFRRLDMLAAQTVMEHGTAQESAEAQSYLVENFSADALPLDQEESTTDDLADSARRLERLQRDNSRLTGSNFSRSHSGNAKTANTPRRRIQRVETAGMTPSAAMGAASGNQQHPPRSRIQRVGVAPAATPMDIDSDPPATSSKRRLTASEDASGVVERSRKRLRKGGA